MDVRLWVCVSRGWGACVSRAGGRWAVGQALGRRNQNRNRKTLNRKMGIGGIQNANPWNRNWNSVESKLVGSGIKSALSKRVRRSARVVGVAGRPANAAEQARQHDSDRDRRWVGGRCYAASAPASTR